MAVLSVEFQKILSLREIETLPQIPGNSQEMREG